MADSLPRDDQQSEQPKRPVGRPLKYKTVEELDLAIQLYFDKCDPHIETHLTATGVTANGETMFEERKVLTDQKPYTMSGLARALGLSRQALLEYSQRDEFGDSVAAAKQRCEEFWEGQLATPYANGAKFNLINNYRGSYQPWADKQEIAGPGDTPLVQTLVKIVDGKAQDEADQDSRD